MPHALRPYQVEAVEFFDARQRAILGDPPGAGKTAVVATWLPDDGRVLIVAPNGPVLHHWKDELARWNSTLVAAQGIGTPGVRKLARAGVTNGVALVLNYECMRQDIDELIKIRWDAVVFDEAHRLKGRKVTFKAAAKLARRTERIALVTGTPLLNHPEELWTLLHCLDPKAFSSFWTWAERRFEINFRKHRGRLVREVGDMLPGVAAILNKQLAGLMIQRPLEVILPDLPPVTETYLDVALTAAERKMHDSMNDKYWMEYGGELVVAPNKITQSLRLRQLASDWSAFGGEELGSKGRACVDLIGDLGDEPVVVFCAFRSTVTALVQALNPEHKAVQYHGGMDANTRQAALHQFVTGKRKVLVGTISTMGEGIDGMQRVARNVIFMDRDWTPARNDQAVGRLQRAGQQSNVNVIHLVAEDSMDDVVADALRRKRSVIDAVLGVSPTAHNQPPSATGRERDYAVHRK